MRPVFFAAGAAGTVVSTVTPPRWREWLGYGPLALGVLVTIAAMLLTTLPLYVAGSAVAGLASQRFGLEPTAVAYAALEVALILIAAQSSATGGSVG